MAKARLIKAGKLTPEYADRFCHPTGTDGQFLAFFKLAQEQVVAAADLNDEELARWFLDLPAAGGHRTAEWNHLAQNLGRPGFPMADRLPVALATTYRHLADKKLLTVFEILEADEANA